MTVYLGKSNFARSRRNLPKTKMRRTDKDEMRLIMSRKEKSDMWSQKIPTSFIAKDRIFCYSENLWFTGTAFYCYHLIHKMWQILHKPSPGLTNHLFKQASVLDPNWLMTESYWLKCCCILLYRCMLNIFNTITTSRHSSLEKYTSHFIERVVCENELETDQNCNILTNHSSGHNSVFFLFSWAAQPGAWGTSLCWDMVDIPASSLQLIWTSCRRGYIIIWRPPTSCERHNSHSIQPLDSQGRPWSPDIFNHIHLLFTQVHFFFWQLGRVGGQ